MRAPYPPRSMTIVWASTTSSPSAPRSSPSVLRAVTLVATVLVWLFPFSSVTVTRWLPMKGIISYASRIFDDGPIPQ